MEYFRKIITRDDVTNGNVGAYLSNFGFVDQDGKTLSGKNLYQTPMTTQIYWKNDDNKFSCVRSIDPTTDNAMGYTYRYYSSGGWQYQGPMANSDADHWQSSLLGPTSIYQPGTENKNYSQLSLIKLTNGGFIWNTRFLYRETSPVSLVLMNSNYYNSSWTDTGRLLNYINPNQNMTVIGIAPSQSSIAIQPTYTYISYFKLDGEDSWNYKYLRMLWDFGDKIINNTQADHHVGNFTRTTPGYENLIYDINNAQYTNLNKNVCVLIKMPYESGYLENIYIMSTAPSNFKSGGVFSFAGRTFINLYSNIVVELPND